MNPSRRIRSRLPFPACLVVLLVGLSVISPLASAQVLDHGNHTEAGHIVSNDYVVEVTPSGDVVCRQADPGEALALRPEPNEPLNLTVFSSTNAERDITGMRILLRATDQILEFPDALLAFRRAAARWERAITTPITVVIDVDYGPRRFGSDTFGPNTIASATNGARSLDGIGPAEIVDALKAQHPDDEQLQAFYDAIPIPTPSTAGEPLATAVFSRPLAQAFGLLPPSSNPDPIANPFGEFATIGFNSAFSFDLNPSDGISAGLTDFEGVAVHEIGHSLGFTSIIGTGGPPENRFSILDFFRVRPEAVEGGEPLDDGQGWEVAERVTTPGPPSSDVVQVFFDGLQEYPLSTSANDGSGGDGEQASHWRDDAFGGGRVGIMDPTFPSGLRGTVTRADLRAMEVIGFDVLYDVPRSDVAVTVQDVSYDTAPQDSVRFLDAGDFAVGEGGTITVELENTSLEVPLAYASEVVFEYTAPSGVEPTVDFTPGDGSGTVAPGETATIALEVEADEPFVFYGTLIVETNAADNLVIDIPFTFSFGGGTAPNLEVAENIGDLGNAEEGGVLTATFEAANEGTVALDYRASVTLARRAIPFSTEPAAMAARGIAPIFEEDFDDGTLGAFTAGGSFPGDWQVIAFGPADLEGHSQPDAAYFGQERARAPEDLQYRNQAVGTLLSPSLDLSETSQEDLVVLTFNTYLQAEEGFDFASVLVSLDDGETFIEVATSDDGILQNTDDGWETLEIELPILSGYPFPVRFAFQFITDAFVTDVGWFIDDVVLTTRQGENPVFVSPPFDTLAGEETQELTLTIRGDNLERGFYRGEVGFVSNSFELSAAGLPIGFKDTQGLRFVGREEAVEFTFTVAEPAFPTLVPTEEKIAVTFTAFGGQEEEVEVSNGGDEALSFVRILEPAMSQYDDERAALRLAEAEQLRERLASEDRPTAAHDAERTAHPGRTLSERVQAAQRSGPTADSLGAALIPAAGRLATDIAQFPDGRLAVLERNGLRVFVYNEEFFRDGVSAEPTVYTLPSFFGSDNPTSLAYNGRTGSFWVGTAQRKRLYEVRFPASGHEVERTGQSVSLDFLPSSADYSPELDAYFVVEYGTPWLHAVGSDGVELPGYPVETVGDSFYRGLSLTGGVIEIGTDDLIDGDAVTFTSFDQFANEFVNHLAATTVVEVPLLQILSRRINGLLRSRTQPNEVMYYVTNAGAGGVRLLAVDPPDLPERYLVNNIEAGEPLYGKNIAPKETKALTVVFNGDGLETDGMIQDTLAFLTNNPGDRVVRIPVKLTVTNVANEGEVGRPTAFALRQNYPNPFAARTRLVFDLPTASRVTLGVYDVLGQRVAVLRDNAVMEAGTQEVPFDGSRLASGTYVVRLQAGPYVGTQRLTLVK